MADPYVDIRCGDAIEVMAGMAADSVDMVCSSPPYWGLRRYAGEQERIWADGSKAAFGLEKSPEEYLSHTLEVLRAIRRVLKPTGVVWWNIGDSYAGGGNYRGHSVLSEKQASNGGAIGQVGAMPIPEGLKPLDLCLIPEQVALAACQDGWYVRSIVVWAKPNPMPESVSGWRWERHRMKVKKQATRADNKKGKMYDRQGSFDDRYDRGIGMAEYQPCPGCPKCAPNDGLVLRKGSWRPTDAHEYLLMLAKSHEYYSDGEDVRETQSEGTFRRYGKDSRIPPKRKWSTKSERGGESNTNMQEHIESRDGAMMAILPSGRNLRSVWNFPTQSFKGAHFAVFPERLPEICILSSTPAAGVCSKCGRPYARVIDKAKPPASVYTSSAKPEEINPVGNHQVGMGQKYQNWRESHPSQTLGFRPTCTCKAPSEPALVLDCFAGSGTSGVVAKRLGRKAILIDISPEYCEMARKRVEATPAPMRLEC